VNVHNPAKRLAVAATALSERPPLPPSSPPPPKQQQQQQQQPSAQQPTDSVTLTKLGQEVNDLAR